MMASAQAITHPDGEQMVVGYDLTKYLKVDFFSCGALQCSLKIILRVKTYFFACGALQYYSLEFINGDL